MIRGKTGIALLNMGSPASPGDIRRFLRQLFLDIEMFHFPGERLVRPFFAALISSLRAGRVRRRYRVLGGTSPLLHKECSLTECIFHDGSDNCWSLVSPFKMRRRPSLLLKDTAERCMCLSIPCTECEHYED